MDTQTDNLKQIDQQPSLPEASLPIGRIKRSFMLLKQSYRAMKQDKSLLGVQVLGMILGIAFVAVVAIFMIILFINLAAAGVIDALEDVGFLGNILYFALLLAFSILAATLNSYILVALSYGALRVFDGENITVKECYRAANQRLGTIFSFGIVAGTVGFILNMLEERASWLGKVAVWLVGAAWSVATMFVPAIIASRSDRLSGLQLVRKSAEMLKNLWGESLVVAISVGLAGFIMILGAFAGGALFSVIMTEVLGGAGLGLGIALTFITLIILYIIISTLGTIANTALYYYATHG